MLHPRSRSLLISFVVLALLELAHPLSAESGEEGRQPETPRSPPKYDIFRDAKLPGPNRARSQQDAPRTPQDHNELRHRT